MHADIIAIAIATQNCMSFMELQRIERNAVSTIYIAKGVEICYTLSTYPTLLGLKVFAN